MISLNLTNFLITEDTVRSKVEFHPKYNLKE